MGRFGTLPLSPDAPSPASGDSLALKKDGTNKLVDCTLAELNVVGGLSYPTADGTANQILNTDGSGALSFTNRVVVEEFTFTEAAGGAAQTYTASCNVPAGAYILDVVVHAVALWDDATAATMKVGTSTPDDDNGYFTGINLKATDLLVGEYLRASDISAWGGKEGVYLTAAGLQTSYSATARVVTFIVNTTAGGGTAGRTRCYVMYMVPDSTTAATQAAT